MKFKGILFAALAAGMLAVPVAAQEKADEKADYEFKTVKENWISPIKNQYRSGTCWCYSALSFIESEVYRLTGNDNVDLSEMFVVGNAYRDRAIKYVRLDGHLNLAAGSSFGDVLHVIKDYGCIEEGAYNGMNYGTEMPEQNELDAVVKGYVDAVKDVPNRNKLTTAWVNGLQGILDAYLGEVPSTFEVNGKEYTPESYRDFLKINTDDYVNLTSFTHHPFYEPFVIEVCDNWRWDSAYNLPIDELMEVMFNAVEKGFTIAWGSDVSERGFTRDGLAVLLADKSKAAGSDQERWTGKADVKAEEVAKVALPEEVATVTQEDRQDGYDRKYTTDDHGMHIYGLAQDQNGTNYFMVKNSWGKAGKYDGIWYASEKFVKAKTMNIVVHKDALPKSIKKKLGIK